MFDPPMYFPYNSPQMSDPKIPQKLAQRSPPLWKLPDLQRQGTTTPTASPPDSNSSSTSSSQAENMNNAFGLYRLPARAVRASPERPSPAEKTSVRGAVTLNEPSGPIAKPPKPFCCPFPNLRATSLRLQSNEHTWDAVLLRFVRLEPGEVIHSPARNHLVQVTVSMTRDDEPLRTKGLWGQAKTEGNACDREAIRELCGTHYFGIHLLDGINTPALSSSYLPTSSSQTKTYARGRYVELPLSRDFAKRLNLAGSICFWCNEHGLWHEVSILSGSHDGSWRDMGSARSSPVL